MNKFMDDDFLLSTQTAKMLFHKYCKEMPICDYHCHLSPKEIYENKPFYNLCDLWLGADHYKWRVMRSCGVSEDYCTGDKPSKERFEKFAYAVQYAIGNPVYHWANLELKRYFNIDEPLCSKNAESIYSKANEFMADGHFKPQSIIKASNVKVICTTDDPIDDLKYHKLLQNNDFDCMILPTFRADKALNITDSGFADYIKLLSNAAGIEINSADDVITALCKRADYFSSVGCKISDQSFLYVPFAEADGENANDVFLCAMNGKKISRAQADIYTTKIMTALGEKYFELGWAMEIHIGAMRNNNKRMFDLKGTDIGFDSIGDNNIALGLSRFLNSLDYRGKLPKTVLFNLNNKDNYALGTMLGNFQSDEADSKMQYGPAWWFLDSIDGMTQQMKTLGNLGVLGKFIGMETDSRSFTSFTRHEYFRRIMCALIGEWVENGMYPNDEKMLAEIVQGICFNNAMKYFDF